MPARGIGTRSLDVLRLHARANQLSMWQATIKIIEEDGLAARSANSLKAFLQLIDDLAKETKDMALAEIIEQTLFGSGLLAHYRSESGEKAQARVENLEELMNAAREFNLPEDDNMMEPLAAFLSHAALEAGDGQAQPFEDCVQMMTLHSAKGLEFPMVVIAGMEEGLFPHRLSLDDAHGLAEERRLCYVGMTRAMQRLYLTYAQVRRFYGEEHYHTVSRFISEIPNEFLDEVRMKASVSRPMGGGGYSRGVGQSSGYGGGNYGGSRSYGGRDARASQQKFVDTSAGTDLGLKIGQHVEHPSFGEGVILSFEGRGANARIQVQFQEVGTKWLVANYAKLTSV